MRPTRSRGRSGSVVVVEGNFSDATKQLFSLLRSTTAISAASVLFVTFERPAKTCCILASAGLAAAHAWSMGFDAAVLAEDDVDVVFAVDGQGAGSSRIRRRQGLPARLLKRLLCDVPASALAVVESPRSPYDSCRRSDRAKRNRAPQLSRNLRCCIASHPQSRPDFQRLGLAVTAQRGARCSLTTIILSVRYHGRTRREHAET